MTAGARRVELSVEGRSLENFAPGFDSLIITQIDEELQISHSFIFTFLFEFIIGPRKLIYFFVLFNYDRTSKLFA